MTEMDYAETVKRLASAREKAGISQRKMAVALGLTPSALSMIESGERNTGFPTLLAYAEKVGLRLDFTLTPQTGTVQVDVPQQLRPLIDAARSLDDGMVGEITTIISFLPAAPSEFRAGILAALRTMAHALPGRLQPAS